MFDNVVSLSWEKPLKQQSDILVTNAAGTLFLLSKRVSLVTLHFNTSRPSWSFWNGLEFLKMFGLFISFANFGLVLVSLYFS